MKTPIFSRGRRELWRESFERWNGRQFTKDEESAFAAGFGAGARLAIKKAVSKEILELKALMRDVAELECPAALRPAASKLPPCDCLSCRAHRLVRR